MFTTPSSLSLAKWVTLYPLWQLLIPAKLRRSSHDTRSAADPALAWSLVKLALVVESLIVLGLATQAGKIHRASNGPSPSLPNFAAPDIPCLPAMATDSANANPTLMMYQIWGVRRSQSKSSSAMKPSIHDPMSVTDAFSVTTPTILLAHDMSHDHVIPRWTLHTHA